MICNLIWLTNVTDMGEMLMAAYVKKIYADQFWEQDAILHS